MIDTIYIARHGFKLESVTGEWSSVTGVRRDCALAPHGIAQAKELAQHFVSMAPEDRPSAIFTSSQYRCVETAAQIGDVLERPLYVEHGIGQWFPADRPQPSASDATTMHKYFPQVDLSYSSVWLEAPRPEEVDEFHERTQKFLTALIPRIERDFGGKHRNILFITHASLVAALVRTLVGDRGFTFRIGTCSLTTLRRKEDARAVVGGWTVKSLDDARFLTNGIEDDWGFEDVEIRGVRAML